MTVVAILQARVSSTRLPGKVLLPLAGAPMLQRQIERVRRARLVDKLIVATSSEPADAAILELCRHLGVDSFAGSLDDVLDRFVKAARAAAPDWVVRLTGDCPLTDPAVIDLVVQEALTDDLDYASNAIEPTFPDGLDVEVIRMSALEAAWREARLTSEREHVTPFVRKRPERFRVSNVRQAEDLSHLRWTVDEPADYKLVTHIYDTLFPANPDFATADILKLLESEPELATLNTVHGRDEGYAKSLKEDKMIPNTSRYVKSEVLLDRALRTIPLGSQTFSKSKTQFPFGVSPYFIERGNGSHVWDADGNEYVDFINGLCAVTLGYCDPDVDAAVKEQMDQGVIFSLPHPIESQVAEAIVEVIPCAEKVRFGKNGSDATAGAVRVARAHTGRDRVAVCGYHGWQDWYIGATARNLGVPKATRELTHQFAYNDLDSLDRLLKSHEGEFAAVILEPMNTTAPTPEFLGGVKELAHRHGALLIFDETITGFRFSVGGAQEKFGVTPDLATFGKGLANGYPLSAVAGRADVMKLMEEVFFSFTFGGETLSLAAAKATLRKLRAEPVIETMERQGRKIMEGTKALLDKHDLNDVIALSGEPTWSFLTFRDAGGYSLWQIKTLFVQEIFARGILAYGSHNMSYSHSDDDVQKLLSTYDDVFSIIRSAIRMRNLDAQLRCEPLQPLFKVR